MKARLVIDVETTHGPKKVGDIIAHKDAHMLVRGGVAEPADDYCREKANMTDEEMAYVQLRYQRLVTGQILEGVGTGPAAAEADDDDNDAEWWDADPPTPEPDDDTTEPEAD